VTEETSGKVILAVDDMLVNLTAVRSILQNEFDVRPAKSAKMALVMLNTIKADLILLDVEMPEMSGFELLDQIRNNPEYAAYKDIPVIFVTSHETPEFTAQAVSGGAQGYVVKPIVPAVLTEKIKSVFKAAKGENSERPGGHL
jgi:putative two-component system response regulator